VTTAAEISANLTRVRERIAEASARCARAPDEVLLVGVTKTLPLQVCVEAWESGLADLGENYVRELREKAPELPDVRWHYLGPVQSHTANAVADHADLVHSLGSLRSARRLASRRVTSGAPPLPVLVQVDFTAERHGVVPDELGPFLDALAALEGLELRGLMTLPPITDTAEGARPYFRQLRDLRDRLAGDHPSLRELSMGMSLDYEVAVEEGATMVRVGTTLFGERNKH
jgi:pyridoxal phosphate enzyme (YggS family)